MESMTGSMTTIEVSVDRPVKSHIMGLLHHRPLAGPQAGTATRNAACASIKRTINQRRNDRRPRSAASVLDHTQTD